MKTSRFDTVIVVVPMDRTRNYIQQQPSKHWVWYQEQIKNACYLESHLLFCDFASILGDWDGDWRLALHGRNHCFNNAGFDNPVLMAHEFSSYIALDIFAALDLVLQDDKSFLKRHILMDLWLSRYCAYFRFEER